MEYYVTKQRDIIDSQRFYDVMKTHRAKLRVNMSNKDVLIMYYALFSFV